MKTINNLSDQSVQLCAESGPGDGIDPRYLARQNDKKTGSRNTARLGSEIAKVVSLLLAEMANPKLQILQVKDVEVMGHGQSVCINIGHYQTDMPFESAVILSELQRIQGRIRSGITQAINRKRVPIVKFHYVGIMEME